VDRERRDDRVDARPVLEAGVDEGRRLVDATADAGDDSLDHATKLRLARESARRLVEPAVALDVDLVVAVDHDLADTRVVEQSLERPEAEHVGPDLGDEAVALGRCQRDLLDLDDAPELLAGDAMQFL